MEVNTTLEEVRFTGSVQKRAEMVNYDLVEQCETKQERAVSYEMMTLEMKVESQCLLINFLFLG